MSLDNGLNAGTGNFPKYLDPESLVVYVHIDGTIVPHTLIDLGASINVMTKDTILKLNL